MKQAFILCLLAIGFCACSRDDIPHPNSIEQTILVYMAGENSLSSNAQSNLSSIVAGARNASIGKANLLVYIDIKQSLPKLYQIAENKSGVVDTVLVKTYDEQNSADGDIMRGVITEVFDNYPAPEKGLFLWSHGTAWLPSNLSNYLRSFGQDGTNHMEITELKEALLEGFDYIVFDACYMASVEVAYELRDKADYLIGSSVEILAEGFPYTLTIPTLLSSASLEERLESACESFYNYYATHSGSEAYRTGNISLIKTSGLVDLASACRKVLGDTYMDERMIDPSTYGLNLQALEYLTAPYSYSFLYDFTEYVSVLESGTSLDLSDVVLYKQTTPTAFFDEPNQTKPIHTYSGMSIYVPQVRNPKLNEWYRRLEWYQAVYE
jgi:hypothetical protein